MKLTLISTLLFFSSLASANVTLSPGQSTTIAGVPVLCSAQTFDADSLSDEQILNVAEEATGSPLSKCSIWCSDPSASGNYCLLSLQSHYYQDSTGNTHLTTTATAAALRAYIKAGLCN